MYLSMVQQIGLSGSWSRQRHKRKFEVISLSANDYMWLYDYKYDLMIICQYIIWAQIICRYISTYNLCYETIFFEKQWNLPVQSWTLYIHTHCWYSDKLCWQIHQTKYISTIQQTVTDMPYVTKRNKSLSRPHLCFATA